MPQKYRVNVYIDGFNLYHAIDDLGDNSLKWVDLYQLSTTILNPYQILNEVKYFSAYATWRPDAYKRHRDFVAANEAQGVEVIMGRFKAKEILCKAKCGQSFWTHEEKETDVNIGAHLIADTLQNKFDTALIISADTDLAAVIKLAISLTNSTKRIYAVAPPGRMSRSRELEHLFMITKGKIRASILPEHVLTPSGTITRPQEYTQN
jgi:uncharacterized LabA/DUF88 family protein